MQYVIRCGDHQVTPRAYLAALKMAMANPTTEFSGSFRSSWIPATGSEIVRQHWQMIREKYQSQLPETGKGNRAAKRLQAIRDARATCKWCGSPIPTERQEFCGKSCCQSYWG